MRRASLVIYITFTVTESGPSDETYFTSVKRISIKTWCLEGFLLTREFITKSLEFQTTSNWLSWPLLQHSSLSPTFTKYFLNDYLCRWRLQFVQHWLFDEISQLFTQIFSEQNWYQLCDVMSVVCGGEYHDHMFTLRAPISNWQVRAMQLRVAQTSLATLLGTHILYTFSWGIRIEIRRYLT